MSLIVWTIVSIFFNLMDSVSTELCMRQYPEVGIKGESNPLMRWLMFRNKWVSFFIKQIAVLIILTFLWRLNDIASIRIIGIVLCLVVMNNMFIVISRAITRRKVISPLRKLQSIYHIPERWLYPLAVFILIVASLNISLLLDYLF